MDDERARKEHFKDMVSRADTFELIQLIKMLIEHREKVVARGKKLHVADERMLQEAEKYAVPAAPWLFLHVAQLGGLICCSQAVDDFI